MTRAQFLAELATVTDAFEFLRLLGRAADLAGGGVASVHISALVVAMNAARDLFERVPVQLQIDDAQWQEIRLWVLGRPAKESVALTAFSILRALDSLPSFGPEIIRLFENQEFRVGVGDLFPVVSLNLRCLYGRAAPFVPRVMNTEQPQHAFEHLGYLPTIPAGMSVNFDTRSFLGLAQLSANPRVAICLPNLDAAKEFDLDVDPGGLTFSNYRPIDHSTQEAHLLAVLDRASARQANIVLFPELCTSRALSNTLGARVRTSQLGLVVCGSFHERETATATQTADPEFWNNIAEAYSHAAPRRHFGHQKFNPFALTRWRGQNVAPPLLENIDTTEPQLTVYFGSGWSFCILICKDAFAANALQLLRQIRPNFLFVVALSENTFPFHALGSLASAAQTTVVVANFGGGPPAHGAFEAMAILPTASAQPVVGHRRLGAHGARGVHILNLLEPLDGWEWHQV